MGLKPGLVIRSLSKVVIYKCDLYNLCANICFMGNGVKYVEYGRRVNLKEQRAMLATGICLETV